MPKAVLKMKSVNKYIVLSSECHPKTTRINCIAKNIFRNRKNRVCGLIVHVLVYAAVK